MKYYSDKTRKIYDTTEALTVAETDFDSLVEQKKQLSLQKSERAKEIEAAFTKISEAQEAYNLLVNNFIKDYGSYHSTRTSLITFNPFKWFDNFWFD